MQALLTSRNCILHKLIISLVLSLAPPPVICTPTHTQIQTTDKTLAAIEEEIRYIIAASIDTVEKFRRWQAETPKEGAKSEIIPWSCESIGMHDCKRFCVHALSQGSQALASRDCGRELESEIVSYSCVLCPR